MEAQAWKGLAERLDVLERERRQSLWVAAVFFCGVMVLLAGGFAPLRRPKVVEAERIVLKDGEGKPRALLTTAPDGSPSLALLDGQGRNQVVLSGAADETASLSLHGDGQARLFLTAARDGTASMSLFDKAGRSGAGMYLYPDSTVGLELRNGDNGVIAAAQPDGLNGLAVAGPEGQARDRVGALPEEVRLRDGRWGYGAPPFQVPGVLGSPTRPGPSPVVSPLRPSAEAGPLAQRPVEH